MKKENHKRLRNRKRRIAHRLRDRIWSDQAQPMLRGRNSYELSERTRGLDTGGIGVMHVLAQQVGLDAEINQGVSVLKVHLPYHESDHVLSIAYNALCGGECLEDIEWRRTNEVYLDALGASRVPDPTTAGDYCRRFEVSDIENLMTAVNETRLRPSHEGAGGAIRSGLGACPPCRVSEGHLPRRYGLRRPGIWTPGPLRASASSLGWMGIRT